MIEEKKMMTISFVLQTNYTCSYHQVLHPPSTIMFCPVINEPASVVKKAVAPLRSLEIQFYSMELFQTIFINLGFLFECV